MARNIRLKPNQPPRRYVSLDVTGCVDSVAFGQMWNRTFGWKNLLWDLRQDDDDKHRRVDVSHPTLPVRWLKKSLGKTSFADTCILPQGEDGHGMDPLWEGTDAFENLDEMNAADQFMQTFILSPTADKASSSLNDSGMGVVADVVYISSHGVLGGEMVGEQDRADHIFAPAVVASQGRQFSGVGWLLLSNCSTLNAVGHEFWLKLMNGPVPLRGITGFQRSCPSAKGSVRVFKAFIDELAGKNKIKRPRTFVDAWAHGASANGSDDWVVLCHESAAEDTIGKWNSDKLAPIPSAGSRIFMFDHGHPPGKGVEVVPNNDPFHVSWATKGGSVTPANRTDPDRKLAVGDMVMVTVEPPPPGFGAKFKVGDTIALTLVYIRVDYPQKIDVVQMFDVVRHGTTSAPTTAKRNPKSPGGDDTWEMVVTDETPNVDLLLKFTDRMGMHSNYPLWLRARITTAGQTTTYDFRQFGAINLK
jgi:hypothetical protein